MNDTNFIRNTAIKITIRDILTGAYVQDDATQPSALITQRYGKIYRLNLMGIIVQKEKIGSLTNLLIDDGTGKIICRFFEENSKIDALIVGDALITIGKARVFNQEKYFSPEIFTKVDPLWLKVRSLEVKSAGTIPENLSLPPTKTESQELNTIEEEIIEDQELPFKKIAQLIQTMDQGNGVLIEEILEKSMIQGTEKIIEKMLQEGNIFQNQPGRVKVL